MGAHDNYVRKRAVYQIMSSATFQSKMFITNRIVDTISEDVTFCRNNLISDAI